MTTPVLTTDRLILRAPDKRDEPAMLGFFTGERARFYGGAYDLGGAWRYFAAQVGHWALRGYGMFAITEKDSGGTLGLAGPWHPPSFPEPEMAWLLTEAQHEGKGFAVEAVGAALAHVFAVHRWASLPSYIDRDNSASRKLARRLGAVPDPGHVAPIGNCETFRHFAPEARA